MAAWTPTEPSNVNVLLIGTPQTIGSCARQMARGVLPDHQVVGAVTLHQTADLPDWSPDIPLLGAVNTLEKVLRDHPIDVALVSLPAVMTNAMLRIRTTLRDAGVGVRQMPTLEDVLIHGERVGGVRHSFGINALDPALIIGRPGRTVDMDLARPLLANRRVLITGAGGSIGSELARICASCGPSRLIMMERSENALFEIDRQIAARHPEVMRRAILHDVVEAEGTRRWLHEEKPDVVFHAAAHKHVPMMEDHPSAAVNNNVFGTRAVADAAIEVGVSRFVMISTDKAVNPSSVMGATKRLAELYCRGLNTLPENTTTEFRIVRFGNVLGSACSVLPIWLNQLADGGPITVTDPRMTRYFMTIPEAAALVIQAGALECNGAASVFELDMGDPISILDIAVRLIRLCGLRPTVEGVSTSSLSHETRRLLGSMADGTPVPVVISGIRPGEKLHEELAYQMEDLKPTACDGVLAWSGADPASSDIRTMIGDLESIRAEHSREAVLSVLIRHIPEMRGSVSPTPPADVQAA